MKTILLIAATALFFSAGPVSAQELQQSQVPLVVVNNFQQAFPKASRIEWEMDGEMYRVEFETGLMGTDHDAWYDNSGKLVKHKEEISANDLPEGVRTRIKNEYSGFRIDDVKKISEGTKITYTLELKSFTEEWQMLFDADGNILGKVRD